MAPLKGWIARYVAVCPDNKRACLRICPTDREIAKSASPYPILSFYQPLEIFPAIDR
jgi:hypothetical protein